MVKPSIPRPWIDDIKQSEVDDERFRIEGWPKKRDPEIRRRVVEWLEDWWARYSDKKTYVPATQLDGLRVPEPPTCLLGSQLNPEAMRALIALKGWTVLDLASWWEMSPATLSRFVSDPNRPRYVDDMVWGLAPYEEPATDWWRRKLLERSAGHYERQLTFRRGVGGAKASSFTRYGGRLPGHLYSPRRAPKGAAE